MDFISKIESLFESNDKETFIPQTEQFDSKLLGQIMIHAKNPKQTGKVLQTATYLKELWKDSDAAEIPNAMVMVKENYKAMAKMAELEPMSTKWLEELEKVSTNTAENL